MYLYLYYIFGHAQIYTNVYFDSSYFSAEGINFVVSLLFIEDII